LKTRKYFQVSMVINVFLVVLIVMMALNIKKINDVQVDNSSEVSTDKFEYTTYGQYSEQDFTEVINNNLIDQTMKKKSFISTGDAINEYQRYENCWQNEFNKTYEALFALKDDKTLDRYEDVVEFVNNLDAYLDTWTDYLNKQTNIEADFFNTGYSMYIPAISLNRAYEIREMVLKLKEYYYVFTGEIIFYYDDYIDS